MEVIALIFVVIFVLLLPILVAIVAERATAKSLTDVIRVLLLSILVASATDVAANSASVTKPVPSPITELIEVIAAAFTEVAAETRVMRESRSTPLRVAALTIVS